MKYFKRILISLAFIFLLLPVINENNVYALTGSWDIVYDSGSKDHTYNGDVEQLDLTPYETRTYSFTWKIEYGEHGWLYDGPEQATHNNYWFLTVTDDYGNTAYCTAKNGLSAKLNCRNLKGDCIVKLICWTNGRDLWLNPVTGGCTSYTLATPSFAAITANGNSVFSSGNLTPVKFRINIILFNTIFCVSIRFDC